ncbi:MAG: TraR/DksA C4-type zinc finger protein [Thermaerobacter sp.]|nr:transcriptional regulator [Bacillota bacterium]REJ33998.1 MAG: transcriptional regulator [Bacillota bacterium]
MRHPQLSGDHLRRLRDRLLAERSQLRDRVRRMDDLDLGRSMGDWLGELSTYDNHPADIGDELHQRSRDLGLKIRFRRRLEEVDHALELMRRGEYGICTGCGRPIPLERLEVQPAAVRCTACQQAVDDAGSIARPAEEEPLALHWRRLMDDDVDPTAAEEVGYDREDAWQEVERYGTSSPPADEAGVTGYEEPFLHHEEAVGAVQAVEAVPAEERVPGGDPDDDAGDGGAVRG